LKIKQNNKINKYNNMANSSKIARGTAAKITARKAAAATASTIKTNRQAALNNAANEAPIQMAKRGGLTAAIAAKKAAKSAPTKPAPAKPAPASKTATLAMQKKKKK
jgi:hypothetical protein